MASVEPRCIGHAGTVPTGSNVMGLSSFNVNASTTPWAGFGFVIEIFFYTNTLSTFNQWVIENNSFSGVIPNCRIRISSPTTVEFEVRVGNSGLAGFSSSTGGVASTVNIPLQIETWYHAVIRGNDFDNEMQFYLGRTGLLRDGAITAGDTFPYGPGNGGSSLIALPNVFSNFLLVPFHVGVGVHTVSLGGSQNATAGGVYSETLIGGMASFRLWNQFRDDSQIFNGAGPNAFVSVDTGDPALEHAWRLNEEAFTLGGLENIGINPGPGWSHIAGGAGVGGGVQNNSYFPSSPFFPGSINYFLPVEEVNDVTELRTRLAAYTRDVEDVNDSTEFRGKMVSDQSEGFENNDITEDRTLGLGLNMPALEDTIGVSESRSVVYTEVGGSTAHQRQDNLGVTEDRSLTMGYQKAAPEDTNDITEAVTRVHGFGGGGTGGAWENEVETIIPGGPDFWFKFDEAAGPTADNAGLAGSAGDGTYTGTTFQEPAIVVGGTNAVTLAGAGDYILNDLAPATPNANRSWFIPVTGFSFVTFVAWIILPTISVVRDILQKQGQFFFRLTAADRLELSGPIPNAATNSSPGLVTAGRHFVAFSFSTVTGVKIFWDGLEVAANPTFTAPPNIVDSVSSGFGMTVATLTGTFAGGTIDEAVMWHTTPMNQAMITQLYVAGNSTAPGGIANEDTNDITEALVRVTGYATKAPEDTNDITEARALTLGLTLPATEDTNDITEALTLTHGTALTDWDVAWRLETTPALVGGSGSHTDFPAYLDYTHNDLRTVANGGTVTSASGFDIAFYPSPVPTGATLDHELIAYDGSTGRIRAFVKVSSLSTSAITSVFLFSGNALITTEQAVPTTYSAYVASPGVILHMEDDPATSSTLTDSSSNADHLVGQVNYGTYNSSDTGTVVVDGIRRNNYVGASAAVSGVYTTAQTLDLDVTFKGWIRGRNFSPTFIEPRNISQNQFFWGLGAAFNGRGLSLRMDPFGTSTGTIGNIFVHWVDTGSVSQVLDSGVNVSEMAGGADALPTPLPWMLFTITWDQTNVRIYRDDTLMATSGSTTMFPTSTLLSFSAFGDRNGSHCVHARYDELWYGIGIAHSDGWVETTYNTEVDGTVDPANFWGSATQIVINQIIEGVTENNSITETRTLSVVHQATLDIIDESEIAATPLEGEAIVAVVNVWNVAMTALGVSTIASTSESSPQADLLNTVWADYRQQWLTQNRWNGAKTTQELSTFQDVGPPVANVAIPGNRWQRAFQLPDSSDTRPYLQALTINGKELTPDNRDFEIEVVENDAGTLRRCLLTNESTVKLEYLFDTTDANIDLLAPTVKFAMGMALAVYIAPHFGKGVREIQDLKQRSQDASVEAKATDSQEGTYRRFQNNPLLDVRH